VRLLLALLLLLAPVYADERKASEDYFRLVKDVNATWAQDVRTYQEAVDVRTSLANSKRVKSLTALHDAAEANLERLRTAKVPASARPLADRWVSLWELKSRLYTLGVEMVKTMTSVSSTREKADQRRGVEDVTRLLKSSQTLSEQIARESSSVTKASQEFLKSLGSDAAIFE